MAPPGLKQRGSKGAQKKGVEPDPTPDDDKARYQKMIEALAEKAPPKVQPYIVMTAPYLGQAAVIVQVVLPYVVQGITVVSEFVASLPETLLYALLGFCICFFGGVFPATIAAYEAWKLCGGTEAVQSVKELYREACKVRDACKEDDQKDEDNDGVPDSLQISGQALVSRKVMLAMKVVDAKNLNTAIAHLWTGWVGVLAVLKIQFARTVTLGEVIGEKLYLPTKTYVEPSVLSAAGEEYKQWVPIGLKWFCKAIGVTVAWWVQRVISAFHSAIRGGLMCGKYVVNFLHEKGYIKVTDEQTHLDEAVGWGIAVLGLLFQFAMGFRAPFPLNILLLPVSTLEWLIVWSVSASW
mmetsp:Transcript_74202/g.172101  ORF Transcript_74202/g.172101 Transcript_74202/m.172101 type:complete len:352 (-) Transcript_74202:141-1196(-)|eukprot:CAMPEP_0171103486 /NCGR_PEP_ID=MMETSP0766_2-20121228/58941_1 /TAXON_ID=439317 /ORGANISM="Gambierdiscus australes, Strain CAWD 149" /LENGTH=351 /DNA_ID=CAMNT_0011563913 /DNA_START=84 /DNA_END=1139 /DNA_ORIENTATION=-